MSDIHRQVGDLTEFTSGNAVAVARLEAELKRLRSALQAGIDMARTVDASNADEVGREFDTFLRIARDAMRS